MTGRISTAQMFDRNQSNVATARGREIRSSTQAGTQKQLLQASDDPTGYIMAEGLKTDLKERDEFIHGGNLALQIINATDGVLERAQDLVQRAHEIAIQASGTDERSSEARRTLKPEIEALRPQFYHHLNTRFGNRTLLAGTDVDKHAFDVRGNYLGNDIIENFEVERGFKIPININAREALLGEGVIGGVNICQAINAVTDGILNDDVEMIRSSLDVLYKATEQLSLSRAKIGGSQRAITLATNSHSDVKVEEASFVSQIEDADTIKAFSDLAKDQTNLQAAMATGHKVISFKPFEEFFK